MSRIAKVMMALAARTAPAHRAEWARSMQAELDHVEARSSLGFAAGCLWSALFWRLMTREGFAGATRLAIAVGSGLLTIYALVLAGRLGVHPVSSVLLGVAGLYGGVGVVAVFGGLRKLALYGALGLCVVTLTILLLPPAQTEPYLRAMAIEAYGMLMLLAFVALTAEWFSRRLRSAA